MGKSWIFGPGACLVSVCRGWTSHRGFISLLSSFVRNELINFCNKKPDLSEVWQLFMPVVHFLKVVLLF